MAVFDLIVTRHPGLVEHLRRTGLITGGEPVVEHAAPADVRGRHVIGVLPLHLAAEAASVTEVPLNLGPDDRGRELSAERVAEVAGPPVTYQVRRVEQPATAQV